jgi:hypothetical protein
VTYLEAHDVLRAIADLETAIQAIRVRVESLEHYIAKKAAQGLEVEAAIIDPPPPLLDQTHRQVEDDAELAESGRPGLVNPRDVTVGPPPFFVTGINPKEFDTFVEFYGRDGVNFMTPHAVRFIYHEESGLAIEVAEGSSFDPGRSMWGVTVLRRTSTGRIKKPFYSVGVCGLSRSVDSWPKASRLVDAIVNLYETGDEDTRREFLSDWGIN